MLIAARNGFAAGGGWKNPYVTDGLIAMWDGEWNAGPGVHDANATVWKDLASDNDLMFVKSSGGEYNITSNSVSFGGSLGGGQYACACGPRQLYPVTMEIVAKFRIAGNKLCFATNDADIVGEPYRRWVRFLSNNGSTDHINIGRNGVDLGARTSNAEYFAGVWESADANSNVSRAYRNGAPKSNYISVNWASLYTPNSSPTSTISPRIDYPFEGDVFAIRLYSRALTADEIAANYTVDKARFSLL